MLYMKKYKKINNVALLSCVFFSIFEPREPSRAPAGGMNNSRVFSYLSKNPISYA